MDTTVPQVTPQNLYSVVRGATRATRAGTRGVWETPETTETQALTHLDPLTLDFLCTGAEASTSIALQTPGPAEATAPKGRRQP